MTQDIRDLRYVTNANRRSEQPGDIYPQSVQDPAHLTRFKEGHMKRRRREEYTWKDTPLGQLITHMFGINYFLLSNVRTRPARRPMIENSPCERAGANGGLE